MRGRLRRSIKWAGKSVWRKRRSPEGGAEDAAGVGASCFTGFSAIPVFSCCSCLGSPAFGFLSATAVFRSGVFSFIDSLSNKVFLPAFFLPLIGHGRSGAAHFSFDYFQYAAAHAFQRGGVNINAVKLVSRLGQV